MEHDLVAATLGIMGLAMLASVFGHLLGSMIRPALRLLVLGITLLLASLYAAILVGRLELIGYFPGGNAVFQSNATPILIFFATGLAWTLPSLHQANRQLRFVSMAGLSVLFFLSPWLRPQIRPVVSDEQARFIDGICLQSHEATCAPAAAATLLTYHGISASEHDLIRRCLTSSDGTEPLGLYRGLAISSQLGRFAPKIASKHPTRWSSLEQFPLIALVSFSDDFRADTASKRRILGRDADGHAIVVFGQRPNGDYVIGDPAVGRTVWEREAFERRFFGNAIYLAKRP